MTTSPGSWLHLGPGNLFRGHIAPLAQRVGATVTAVSMSNPVLREQLDRHGGSYPLAILAHGAVEIEHIDSIDGVLVVADGPRAVIERVAHPSTELITFTITQPAYAYQPGRGLDLDRPEVQRCLSSPDAPTTAIGVLVAGLSVRRRAIDAAVEGGAPRVVSLDGFVGNGDVLRTVVLQYAAERERRTGETGLRDWIAQNVRFPNTMVDRIVPRVTPELRLAVHAAGARDVASAEMLVCTERLPRHSLVIGAPPDDVVLRRLVVGGADVVDDVHVHSRTKVQLLNGAHFVLGIVGQLAGYVHAHEAIADPGVRRHVQRFLDETRATLPPGTGIDYEGFSTEVLSRVANASLPDELVRLARNSSEKVHERIVVPLVAARSVGLPHEALTSSLAHWAAYLRAGSLGHVVVDDRIAKARGLLDLPAGRYGDAAALVDHLLGNAPAALRDGAFISELQRHLDRGAAPQAPSIGGSRRIDLAAAPADRTSAPSLADGRSLGPVG